jgi:hypothetical protein
MAEPILTLDEAAARLRCSNRHAQLLVEAGRLRIVVDDEGREGVSEASIAAWERALAETRAWFETWVRELDDLEAPPE